MGRTILALIFTMAALGCYAKPDTTAYKPAGPLGSRFYFPNSIGISIPSKNSRTTLRNGLAIYTAVEYRPLPVNDVFFKVDYDFLNNNYTSHVNNVPTNIIQGKLGSDFVLLGAGYRKKLERWAIYGELQPGLGMRSFDKATINDNSVLITRASNDSFSGKSSIGLEYYVKSHFDIFFEPSYYKFFNHQGFNSSHSQFTAFNIGISTARF